MYVLKLLYVRITVKTEVYSNIIMQLVYAKNYAHELSHVILNLFICSSF